MTAAHINYAKIANVTELSYFRKQSFERRLHEGASPRYVTTKRSELVENHIMSDLETTAHEVWTYPISEWRAVEEHHEIFALIASVRSTRLFFGRAQAKRLEERSLNISRASSRSRREHDYLLGRLDAAERLIDIVSDAAAMEGAFGKTNIRVLKRDAFRAVLDTEEHHIRDMDLIAQMKSGG